MQFCLCLVLISSVVFATEAPPCVQNINIKTSQWLMPPTKATPGVTCSYIFTFASDSYANLAISATDMSSYPWEIVSVQNDHNNAFDMSPGLSNIAPLSNLSSNTYWPGAFTVTVQPSDFTVMRVLITITIKKLNLPIPSRYITTTTNGPSSLIYLSELRKGTSVSITANSSRVFMTSAVTYQFGQDSRFNTSYRQLSNIFVFENEKSIGSLLTSGLTPMYTQYKSLTVFAVDDITSGVAGALFVSDDTNVIASTSCQAFNYDTVYQSIRKNITTTWGCIGGMYPPAQSNTFIADNGRNTTMTVRNIDNSGQGGVVSYQIGGPTESYKKTAIKIFNADLPITISGQMVTFYISQNSGSLTYDLN